MQSMVLITFLKHGRVFLASGKKIIMNYESKRRNKLSWNIDVYSLFSCKKI